MSMQSIRDTFFEECEELLEALAEGLAQIEQGEADTECLNAVFRAVHSIKGGAGAFALDALVAFAHRFETVLDAIRSDRVTLTDEVMHVLLRSADHLADHVEAARAERVIDPAQTDGFLANLDACLGEAAAELTAAEAAQADADFGFAALTLDIGLDSLDVPDLAASDTEAAPVAPTAATTARSPQPDVHHIDFYPSPQLYTNGHEPAHILAALAALGPADITADLDAMPQTLAEAGDTPAWLGWRITLPATVDLGAIEDCFEFVVGLGRLDIVPASEAAATLNPPAPSLTAPSLAADTGTGTGTGTETVLPALDTSPPDTSPPAARAAEPPAPSAPVGLRKREARGEDDSDGRGPKATLRVDLERVDRLINAVGELIINQAMIEQSVLDMSLPADAEIITHTEDYRLLARDLQEAVMAIRAQPVKPLFQRMSRIVREAAEATGKAAHMVTIGEGTEVDKTVVERLADPLTHMIRNAVDHGLETPEARIAAGKNPEGSIRLSAAHRSGSVIITVKDDGAGLNRAKILEKAISRGLVAPEAELADTEIDNLLFLPGFSTADKISNLSGRGVGLDVVKNAVTALGGRIAISSTPGAGTEFTISLPLTLAVMDGMIISVAGQTMVIPIASVIETIRPSAQDLHMIGTADSLLSIRGRFLPMIDVAQCLGFGERKPGQSPLLLLVETENQSHCALMVDQVLDQRQVVIKGLDSNYGAIPGVSAATVLGDGQIALILDTEALTSNRLIHLNTRVPTATTHHAAAHPPLSQPGAQHAIH